MATKNNGITRAQALESALTLVKESAEFDDKWGEVAEVLEKMHAQLVKPRKANVSKARKLNEGLAQKVHAELVKHGDGATTKDIVNFGIPEITTTQKASAVCRVGVDLGIIRKCVDGKVITYAIA